MTVREHKGLDYKLYKRNRTRKDCRHVGKRYKATFLVQKKPHFPHQLQSMPDGPRFFSTLWHNHHFYPPLLLPPVWFCFAVLSAYLIAIPFIRPAHVHRLLQSVFSIADLLSYCYASCIFDDAIVGGSILPVQESTDERVHLEAEIHLAKERLSIRGLLGH